MGETSVKIIETYKFSLTKVKKTQAIHISNLRQAHYIRRYKPQASYASDTGSIIFRRRRVLM